MVRAVIFDMDGVIVDSEWLHQATEIEVLGEAGLEVTVADLRKFTGMPLVPFLEQLKAAHNADFDPETVAARKRARYLERLDEVDPIDGALGTVRRVGADYPTALATSSHRRVADAVLDRLDLAPAFDTTLSATEVERGKPDPEMFETAADRLGVAPGEAVVVEDSRNGVAAARAGGFRAVGFQSEPEIDLSAAEHVASSMTAVEDYIRRIDESA